MALTTSPPTPPYPSTPGKSWKEPLPESRDPRTSRSAVRQSQPPSSSHSSYAGPERRAGSERRVNHDPYKGVDHRSGNERRSGYNQPDLADAESQRQAELTALQLDLDQRKSDLATERASEPVHTAAQDADFNARQQELEDEQVALDRDKALPPGSPLLSLTSLRRDLIFQLEKQATKGHGLDPDRQLMAEAAQHLRHLMGYTPDEPMVGPDAPYGPVTNEPPIGHSLPGDWPQDRETVPTLGQPLDDGTERFNRDGTVYNPSGRQESQSSVGPIRNRP